MRSLSSISRRDRRQALRGALLVLLTLALCAGHPVIALAQADVGAPPAQPSHASGDPSPVDDAASETAPALKAPGQEPPGVADSDSEAAAAPSKDGAAAEDGAASQGGGSPKTQTEAVNSGTEAGADPAEAGETQGRSGTAVPSEAAPVTDKVPADLSPWGMFKAADMVVKSVLVGLVIASFATWTVWVAKGVEIASAKRRMRRASASIAAAQCLDEAVDHFARVGGTGGALVRAAAEELAQSAPVLDHTSGEGVLARITSRLSRIEASAARRITLGTGVLATIGATAPFVGLFGTVWGIMNSFIGISESQTTNLAVVAPGIAEALLATALGLVAAIPAVVIYNMFARSTAGYRQLLADAAAGVERLVSRDLDFRRVPPAFARAAE